jgi:hypothetical protein
LEDDLADEPGVGDGGADGGLTVGGRSDVGIWKDGGG